MVCRCLSWSVATVLWQTNVPPWLCGIYLWTSLVQPSPMVCQLKRAADTPIFWCKSKWVVQNWGYPKPSQTQIILVWISHGKPWIFRLPHPIPKDTMSCDFCSEVVLIGGAPATIKTRCWVREGHYSTQPSYWVIQMAFGYLWCHQTWQAEKSPGWMQVLIGKSLINDPFFMFDPRLGLLAENLELEPGFLAKMPRTFSLHYILGPLSF